MRGKPQNSSVEKVDMPEENADVTEDGECRDDEEVEEKEEEEADKHDEGNDPGYRDNNYPPSLLTQKGAKLSGKQLRIPIGR